MPRGLKVLLTNNALAERGGSEMYVHDVARALRRAGHEPTAYSTRLGAVADSLRRGGVPAFDELSLLVEPPDVIHGHHHVETLTALLHFPDAPCVAFCHGFLPLEEAPLAFPRIYRHVAVDAACRDRLAGEGGIDPARIEVVPNFVDLERFRPRGPLPPRPRRALAFGNAASDGTYLPAVREACAALGIALDAMGLGSGRPSAEPERELPSYDVVLAKGKAALEALAVGNAVVLCDALGCGPLVGAGNFEWLRRNNFGLRVLADPVTPERLRQRLEAYDPVDAALVAARVRQEAGLDATLARLLALYRQAAAEHARTPRNRPAEGQAAARYLRSMGPALLERARAAFRHEHEILREESARVEEFGLRMQRDAWACERRRAA